MTDTLESGGDARTSASPSASPSASLARAAWPEGETIGALLARSMLRAGDRIALRDRDHLLSGGTRTHADLLGNAARFAAALEGHGIRPGDHVALMLADRCESVEAYVGCFLGGFVAVHVNDRLAPAELDAILSDADARAFVYTVELTRTVVASSAVAAAELVVRIGGDAPVDGHQDWTAMISAAAGDVYRVVPREPGDLAIIGFTSGTTGRPKGVMHSQASLLRIVRHMPVHFDIPPRSRCAFTGTLSFVSGIWGVLLPHLYLGGEISFMSGLGPDEWFARMLAERSTLTYVPTPYAPAFIEQVSRHPEVLDHLRSAVHSGSKMPPATVKALIDAVGPRFIEAYGMTETGAPVTKTEPGDWGVGGAPSRADDVFASTGRGVHIVDIEIVGPDGSVLPAGRTGEITARSDTQFVGYYRRPDLTAETVVDGRIRTGDIGYLDEAGYLYVTDRAKDMIVSGGMNVFPAEVEAALADLPGLAEIAVIGVPDERWGETVVAVAVTTDPDLTEAAIIAAARDRIASYKKPTRVRFASALPRTASLKIDKPALRRQWAADDIS